MTTHQQSSLLLKNSPLLSFWFQENKRKLPWRKQEKKNSSQRNPYSVWISEIMLQQTKVSTVIDYYHRWMKKYPTLKKLAKAKEEEILLLWQGLGYYNRAKNILESAKKICTDYKGILPKEYSKIIKLKGIGEYTAGAICSIAYNQPYVLVDGNVERVICRFLSLEQEVKTIRKEKSIWKILEKVISSVHPQIFNEGLMELGAIICIPQNPKCNDCPLKKDCISYQKKNQNQLPYKKTKQKLIEVFSSCFFIIFQNSSNKKFIILEKRISTSRLKNFWQLPTLEHHDKELSTENLQDIFNQNYFNQKEDFLLENIENNSEKIYLKKITIKKIENKKIHFYTKYKVNLNIYSTVIHFDKKNDRRKDIKNKKLFFLDIDNVNKIPLTTISKKVIKELLT